MDQEIEEGGCEEEDELVIQVGWMIAHDEEEVVSHGEGARV